MTPQTDPEPAWCTVTITSIGPSFTGAKGARLLVREGPGGRLLFDGRGVVEGASADRLTLRLPPGSLLTLDASGRPLTPTEEVFAELLAAYRAAQLDALMTAYLPTGYASDVELAVAQAALARARERLQAEVDAWELRWRAAARSGEEPAP